MYNEKTVYVEQLIKKRTGAREGLIIGLILAGMTLLPLVFLLFEVLASYFIIALGLSIWFGVLLLRLQSVEFEYIVTNGELDVDKISGKSKRKRLLTIDARNFELFAPVSREIFEGLNTEAIRKKLDASSSILSESRYFAIFHSKDGMKTILIFEPNEKVLAAIKPYIRRDALKLQ